MYINKEKLSIPIEQLKELEAALPHGAKKKIAEMTGMHRNSVDKVFEGRWECQEIIDAACVIISKRSGVVKKRRIMIDESLSRWADNGENSLALSN